MASTPKGSATRRTATDPGRFSGWIEYLAGRPNADRFASYIEGREPLLVCAIEVYEVYKVIRRDISEERCGADDRYSGGMVTLAAPDSMRFLSCQML